MSLFERLHHTSERPRISPAMLIIASQFELNEIIAFESRFKPEHPDEPNTASFELIGGYDIVIPTDTV
jgi:hypothetical protein